MKITLVIAMCILSQITAAIAIEGDDEQRVSPDQISCEDIERLQRKLCVSESGIWDVATQSAYEDYLLARDSSYLDRSQAREAGMIYKDLISFR